VLKEGNGNRVQNVITEIEKLRQQVIHDFVLSEQALNISIYYEIGRFDIEVQIEAQTAYILELFLNPTYGLVNISSQFYKDYVFESRTTWKTETLLVDAK
jgi:hypothetical protein